MAGQDFPSSSPIAGTDGIVAPTWLLWMQRVQNVVTAAYSSGPTGGRPTRLLWVGRAYFDTDLGKPVWVKTVDITLPEKAVWVDAAGAEV